MYDCLVFSSGGSKGIAQLGSIHHLLRARPTITEHCHHFVGSSAGAVIAAFLATSQTPKAAMRRHILPFKYEKNIKLSMLSSLFGIESSTSLDRFLEASVGDATFRSVFTEHGNMLSVIGSELTTRSTVIFDPLRSPDMRIRDALRISCSVPLIFPAVERDGKLFVDGALTNSFPVDIARDVYGCKRILGVCIGHESRPVEATDIKRNFHQFMSMLVDTMVSNNVYRGHVGVDVCQLVTPPTVGGLTFDMDEETKWVLWDCGVESMSTFLATLRHEHSS